MAQRYVKLLQASIRPEKGFQLNLTVLEHFGYRFYLYIYYAFAYYAAKRIEGLGDLLPAVAVRNRMALVPTGLGKKLERDWNEQLASPFKPLEMGGAAEVSFRDPASVEQALAQVAETTREDLLQEIRSWASFRTAGNIDLEEVSRELGVDLGYLRHLFESHGVERAFHSQLTCALEPRKITFGRWTKVILSVRNDSDVTLSELVVKISGPVEIRPTRLQLDVPARSTQTAPVALKPSDRGEFPLEVVLALPDEQVFSPWLPVQHLWIECD